MTIDDFLIELDKAVSQGTLTFFKTCGMIRTSDNYECPVCALSNIKHGTLYRENHYLAGKHLGLVSSITIANAADCPDDPYRKVLERACGL